jgi:hypothetical protein
LKDRHQRLTELVGRLLGLPDLIDHQAAIRAETGMVESTFRSSRTCRIQSLDRVVVLGAVRDSGWK